MQVIQQMWVWSLSQEDTLEEGMATHSSILAWRIPWTEEPGMLQFTGWQRLGHNWSALAHAVMMRLSWINPMGPIRDPQGERTQTRRREGGSVTTEAERGLKMLNPKGNQSWMFIGRTDAEAETLTLCRPDAKNWLVGKDPDAGKDGRQEERGDEMVGWHHQLDAHESE